MSTLVCVPIMVNDVAPALEDARGARALGADLVEYRVDELFTGSVAESAVPCILTCRPTWEGGAYDGPEDARVAMFERLGTSDHPPRYIDVELAAYRKSANMRMKVDLAVGAGAGGAADRPGLILSIHDFDGRPHDLTRRVADAWAQHAASVVKIAFRARSLRDNLELFELLRDPPKPTIALGMGEFGLMSRVLAPSFGAFLTFASLRETSATAPGQPTISELLTRYRFRSIGPQTKLYGVIGWPVAHSMGPLIHNAGFEAIGHDGVYLPLPIAADENDPEATYTSFKATLADLIRNDHPNTKPPLLAGASITLPFKQSMLRFSREDQAWEWEPRSADDERLRQAESVGACNTLSFRTDGKHWFPELANTDILAIRQLLAERIGDDRPYSTAIIGAGGVARAAAWATSGDLTIYARSPERAHSMIDLLGKREGALSVKPLDDLPKARAHLFINCTPIGMEGGPEPHGLSIPIHEMDPLPPETIFFDTVYNPMETPMLRAARDRGYQTIEGVEMFVRQAAAQFEMWTNKTAPTQLFDRIIREELQ